MLTVCVLIWVVDYYPLSLKVVPRLAPGQSVDLLTEDGDDTTLEQQDDTRELR